MDFTSFARWTSTLGATPVGCGTRPVFVTVCPWILSLQSLPMPTTSMAKETPWTGAPGNASATEVERKTKTPRLYRVLLHNDDYTTMEFVVMVLVVVFHHSEAEAMRIMLHVHKSGVGVAGVYSREVAETRVQQVTRLARDHEFPLKCTMEPA